MLKCNATSQYAIVFIIYLGLFTQQAIAQSPIYRIFIDADFSNAVESAQAIELGVNTALGEVDYFANGHRLEVVTLNHHGSTRRSLKNIKTFQADPNAIVMIGGMHSPPLLANKHYINDNKLLTIVPWAAAGAITRAERQDNWVFRVSIDDSNAGELIAKSAVNEGFKKTFLLLENTGWGNSNLTTMTQSLNDLSIETKGVARFNWGIGINNAKIMLRRAQNSGADVIFFVGNSSEGKVFAQAMMKLPQSLRLPIRSHWGITGGDFPLHIADELKNPDNLQFIQTRFSLLQQDKTVLQQRVLANIIAKNNAISQPQDVSAQSGFVHAYDATKILISAINQIKTTENIIEDRALVKQALENLTEPVEGLLKTYRMPFSTYNGNNKDAHEALDIQDYVMGYYNRDNHIILLDKNR